MKPEIKLESTLLKSLKEGINLFVGSGFPLLAIDMQGKSLPTGESLLSELRDEFNDLPKSLDLPKSAMYLEKTNKETFIKYLKGRFSVLNFDSKYLNLLKVNLKGIMSTNIDNLFLKLFENSLSMYLNDVTVSGAVFNEAKAIKYVPLHGSIYNNERKLVFSSADISSAFSNDRDMWQYLRMAIEEYPTIFWGYSLNDSGVIQTLFSNPSRESYQKTKWIVLRKKDDSEIKYFEALGFNVIISDTQSFLEYLKEKESEFAETESYKSDYINLNDFKDISIPKIGKGPIRPLSEFFIGAPPIWNDIFSNKIYKTSHYEKIIDLINKSQKHLIVVGTPVSGKTTLMMQIAANYNFNGHKFVSGYIHPTRAHIISKLFWKTKLLFFIDDFRDNLVSIEILSNNPNIKLVCFDREHNYEVISHKIKDSIFDFYDITELTTRDLQAIYDSIPSDIKKKQLVTSKSSEDSIFEFVCLNIEKQSVKERFKMVYGELNNKSNDLLDLFVMCCYCHACRIPVSIDMAFAFLGDNSQHYTEILNTIDQLGKLIRDYDYSDSLIDKDQDYFQPRSHIVAETVMEQIPSVILRRVLNRFHSNVPIFRIVNYHIFKKIAYDKDFFIRAFPEWKEGKEFYDDLYQRDNDFYILQQGALYLANKRKFADAFDWIDLAIQESEGRIFSIKNTHAIIMFEANVNGSSSDPIVRQNLDKSMKILSDCYRIDNRKYYHARIFAVQAIEYYKKYFDSVAKDYLVVAKERLTKELNGQPFFKHKRLRELQKEVTELIEKNEA